MSDCISRLPRNACLNSPISLPPPTLASLMQEAREFRKNYKGKKMVTSKLTGDETGLGFGMGSSGVLEVVDEKGASLVHVPTIFEFMKDYQRLVQICHDGATRSFSFQRLQVCSPLVSPTRSRTACSERSFRTKLARKPSFEPPVARKRLLQSRAARFAPPFRETTRLPKAVPAHYSDRKPLLKP